MENRKKFHSFPVISTAAAVTPRIPDFIKEKRLASESRIGVDLIKVFLDRKEKKEHEDIRRKL